MKTEMGRLSVNFKGDLPTSLFLKPIFFDKDIESIFTIMPNVNLSKKMLFLGRLENILRQKIGCGFKNTAGKVDLSDREMHVTEVEAGLEQCWDEFKDTILVDWLKMGNDLDNLVGTPIADLLVLRVTQGIKRDISRLAFFGDKASADPSYNFVDGLFTVYLPQLIQQNLVPYHNSTAAALNAGDAIDLMDIVVDQASLELRALDNSSKFILVSDTVWLRLKKDLREGVKNSIQYTSEVEGGRQRIFHDGVEVVPMMRWDGLAKNIIGGGAADYYPNLVLYTTKDNLVLGTDMFNRTASVKMWHEDLQEKLYIRSLFRLGFNYVHESLMSVAM